MFMKRNILLLVLLAAIVFGCEDFLTEEPEIAVTNNNFWKNEKDVESAVYGLHSVFRTVFGVVVVWCCVCENTTPRWLLFFFFL